MKKLIISIVTWNSENTIERCLQSVLNQSFSDFDIIIVDNNSKDRTCQIVEGFQEQRIKLFRLDTNTGFCGGHNYSLSLTSSEFVLLVNPDAELKEDYILNAFNKITESDRTGTVCGLLLQSEESDENSVIDSTGLAFSRTGRMKLLNHGKLLKEVRLSESKVFGADGALPLYRRAMIEEVSIDGKYFDEMFFAHKEDWDVSWRSNNLGWDTIFSPKCIAVHPRHFRPNSASYRKTISREITFHAVKNQMILLIKNILLPKDFINIPFIIFRQILILIYILIFERQSLASYRFILKNMPQIIVQRRKQMNKLKTKKNTIYQVS